MIFTEIKKGHKKQIDLASAVTNTKQIISDAKKQVSERVLEITEKPKNSAFTNDVDELIQWVENRNNNIKAEHYEIDPKTLPTLVKVISGGESEINSLPKSEKEKYLNFFKHNSSKIALLTAINPLVGLSTTGAELSASGLMSKEVGIGTLAAGAGILGLSLAASPLLSCLSVGSLAYTGLFSSLGLGLFSLGSGATIFKSIENLPQGKLIVDLFDKTQDEYITCCKQFETNLQILDKLLSEKIKNTADALQSASKKIAIIIDDAIHSDQNMRIMQYQQIILNQYNSQVEIQQGLSELVTKYNSVKLENEKLNKQIIEYRNNMQKLICSSEYLK